MKLSKFATTLCLGASVLLSSAALAHDPSIVLDWLSPAEQKQLDERYKREKESDPYGAWYEAIDIAVARRKQAAERGETRKEAIRRAEKEAKRPVAKYVNKSPGFLRREKKREAAKEAPRLSALIGHLQAYSDQPFAGDDPRVLMLDGNGDLIGVDVEVHADADVAETLFSKLKSPDGKIIGGDASVLVVPPELAVKARMLFGETNAGAVIADSTIATAFRGLYRPVKQARLSDSGYTGYSATAWYLLRDPRVAAVVAVSFLNGRQAPVVEEAQADFYNLGIQMRGYHDFGADRTNEYVAGVQMAGVNV